MTKTRLVGRNYGPDWVSSRYWNVVFGRVSVEVLAEQPQVLRLRHTDLVEQRLCVEALPTNGPAKPKRRRKTAAELRKRQA
jgi:hypothetical protein